MTPGLRRLYMPRPAKVEVDSKRTPVSVDGVGVDAVREEWMLEDRWWTRQPLRRHYYELVLADGRDVTVFRSAFSGRWYRQRA
jgi:hypothetical protein